MENPTPGLKYRPRAGGRRVPIWYADERVVKSGYPVKSANLTHLAGDPVALSQRCQQLQAQMLAWKSGHALPSGSIPDFDGTFRTLIEIYLTDPESPFNKLKPPSRKLYTIYTRKLKVHIGDALIDDTDGRAVNRWFAAWGGKNKLGAARAALAVLKASLSFGVACRLKGCAEFQAVLSQLSFPTLPRRDHAPTAKQMEDAGNAAISDGSPSRALAYALQFETTLRQADVIGEWVGLDDLRPSALIDGRHKWIGPTWAQIDSDVILRVTHGKTDQTTKARGIYDLKECPMVMAIIAAIPVEHRVGPLIVNEATGLPYRYEDFRRGWHSDYAAAGIPAGIWNRDTRAGGITEGGMAGASLDDRAKVAGHSTPATTATVYDRDHVVAHRRTMKARTEFRKK